jgi:hypothetical protein
VEPLTPGDAGFRTTVAEAPPALAEPFALTYSLGEIVGPGGAQTADAAGFVPAAGGLGDDESAAAGVCRSPVLTEGEGDCVRAPLRESFWTTQEGAPW